MKSFLPTSASSRSTTDPQIRHSLPNHRDKDLRVLTLHKNSKTSQKTSKTNASQRYHLPNPGGDRNPVKQSDRLIIRRLFRGERRATKPTRVRLSDVIIGSFSLPSSDNRLQRGFNQAWCYRRVSTHAWGPLTPSVTLPCLLFQLGSIRSVRGDSEVLDLVLSRLGAGKAWNVTGPVQIAWIYGWHFSRCRPVNIKAT